MYKHNLLTQLNVVWASVAYTLLYLIFTFDVLLEVFAKYAKGVEFQWDVARYAHWIWYYEAYRPALEAVMADMHPSQSILTLQLYVAYYILFILKFKL